MQQTTKYHFNLIDDTDTFSPEKLNENTRDFEKELAALTDATAAADAALAADLGSGGKTARIAWGSYRTSDSERTLTFDFRPVVVILMATLSGSYSSVGALVRGVSKGETTSTHYFNNVEWTEDSVSYHLSISGTKTFYYVAIGESLDAEAE